MGLAYFLKSYFVGLLLYLLDVSTINPSEPLKEEPVLFGGNFPALYVFGDSLVDSGNNNHLPTTVKANYPPYGSEFEGGIPTGRFSNGKTIADYIAIYYGLPLVPAYLGLSAQEKINITTGFNYASASCGVFPDTGQALGKCLSLNVQVNLFNKTIVNNLRKQFRRPSELSQHLSESLFMTAIGVNDYLVFYDYTTDDPNEFANRLLHMFLIQIERLHELGARKFFINNVKPLGCYPNIIVDSVPPGSCNERLNYAISIYNDMLRQSLSGLKQKYENTSFLYSDYFNFMLGLRGPSSNTASSSILNTTSACWVGPGSTECEARDTYTFFDPYHPTQMANFMYAISCFHERRICNVVTN